MISIRLKPLLTLITLVVIGVSCTEAETKERTVMPASAQPKTAPSIPGTVYTDLFLDSATVEDYIRAHKMDDQKAGYLHDFYRSRDYQYAWFASDGLDEHGRAFWNLHNNFLGYTRDSSFFNQELHRQMSAIIEEEEKPDTATVKEVELGLTEHFFDYAQYAFIGKINPAELKWHIPQKKVNAVALLDSLIARNGQQLDRWEPVNQQYKAMRQELLRYYAIEKAGGWQPIESEKKVYRLGDSSVVVQQLKERLTLTGDYTSPDKSVQFIAELQAALRKAQKRFGLKHDGVAGPATLQALNIPVSTRIEQMLVNMERMRWMPAQASGKRLVANIPEYKLHVYEDNREVFNMRIVVGKAANKTVVFNEQLKHVVFSPYWNIPRSIVRNEILPAMKNNPGYLSRKNMEQTGTSAGLPVIRQKPGTGNALGKVKFLFPNSYAIYFHDTPAKSLFNQNKRAFSHGCIRLADPKKLAVYLLQDKPGWTEERITEAMNRNSELWVNLEKPVPVEITYFTSWVDDEGLVHFRDDIYGHDKTLAGKLFEND